MSHLIDATEMYLRTVWELDEEGITPIRARLAERLGLSAPAVSETVARLEEEGLLRVQPDRTLALTERGTGIAVSVMRKHRLAERLLTDIIGLEWEQVHNEACRWEHVISDAVEQRLMALLDSPATCPHGNPIPGVTQTETRTVRAMSGAGEGASVTVARISEHLQGNVDSMRWLREHGIHPGVELVLGSADGALTARIDGRVITVPAAIADRVYVTDGVAGRISAA